MSALYHVSPQGGVSYLLASYSAKVCLENYRAAALSRQRERSDQ